MLNPCLRSLQKQFTCSYKKNDFSGQYGNIRTGPIWLFIQSECVKSHINIASGNNAQYCMKLETIKGYKLTLNPFLVIFG